MGGDKCISLPVLSRGRQVQFPVVAHNHNLPALQKMAESPLNGTTQPVDIEEEGLHPTTDRQWLKSSSFYHRWWMTIRTRRFSDSVMNALGWNEKSITNTVGPPPFSCFKLNEKRSLALGELHIKLRGWPRGAEWFMQHSLFTRFTTKQNIKTVCLNIFL